MSDKVFLILFPFVGLLVLFLLLYGPTAFAVLRLKPNLTSRTLLIIALSLLLELIFSVGLAALADRIGLQNPVGYVLLIALIVGLLGGFAVRRFFQQSVIR